MYQTPTEKTLLAQKDMLDAWVSRSKSLPLSFTLRLDLRDDRGGLELGEPAQNLVKSVIALSDRWISLDAECCFDLFHLLAPTVSAKIPMLEHVELVMRSLRTERGSKLPTIMWSKCLSPEFKLRTFSLCGGRFCIFRTSRERGRILHTSRINKFHITIPINHSSLIMTHTTSSPVVPHSKHYPFQSKMPPTPDHSIANDLDPFSVCPT